MAEPTNTSEAQCALSLTRARAVSAAMPYAKGGTQALSSYSEAITVATEKAAVASPEAKDRFELEKLSQSHLSYRSLSSGLYRWVEYFNTCVNAPEIKKLSTPKRAVFSALPSSTA